MIDKIFGITTAFAEQAASAAGTTAAAADGAAEQMTAGNTFVALLTTFLPFVLLFGVMWFVMIRPQRKKDNLKAGDQVCTIGGIYGTIVGIKDDTVTLSVGRDNLTMVIARWGIRSVEEVTIENDAQDLN